MTNTTSTTVMGCAPWCELDVDAHQPAWHDGALRIDHERGFDVEGLASVLVVGEAIYTPAGDQLVLRRDPARVNVEVLTNMLDAAQLRAVAVALTDAADLLDQIDANDATSVSPTFACNGHHRYVDGRCSACNIVMPNGYKQIATL